MAAKKFRDLMGRLGLADDARLPAASDAAHCAAYMERRGVIPPEEVPDARDTIVRLGSPNAAVALNAQSEILRMVNKAAHHSFVKNMNRVDKQARRITSGSFPAVKDKP